MSDSSQENGSALERITDALHPFVSAGVVTLPRLIIGSLILFGIAVNFANVLGRYLFLAPIVWAEEIMIYSMVWMVFIGAVLVSWDGHHLKMDFFSIMLPSPFKEIMNFTGVVCFLLVAIFVLPQTFTVTELMFRLDQRSVVAEIPMVIPHFAILLGFIMMFVVIVWRFKRLIRGDLTSEVEDLVAATEQQEDVPLNRGASG
jgi:TRAP-type C4-dicarboxylate transport system permease small subunit